MVSAPVRVCFVCSGNICRSPTAELVLTRLAAQAGCSELLTVDSAGTGDWHAGDDMDPRTRRTLVHAGYDVPVHCARQFQAADFGDRDLIVALDAGHFHALWLLANKTTDVSAARAKLVLLRAFDAQWQVGDDTDVPDPYYGGAAGFRDVLALVERSCAGLLVAIVTAVRADAPLADVVAQHTGRLPL